MKEFELRLSPSMAWIVVVMILFGSTPSQAQTQSPAAVHIQTYYQQLMPTIQQAGKLSVRERDKRFTPAITAAFDLGTMTRLAVGPAWTSFSPGQQAAVRDAFARFIIADYASQVSNVFGEKASSSSRRQRRNRGAAAKSSRRSCCSQVGGP
jgi:ABC-type transport system involved in resistance to organic solvents, auxiliary component